MPSSLPSELAISHRTGHGGKSPGLPGGVFYPSPLVKFEDPVVSQQLNSQSPIDVKI